MKVFVALFALVAVANCGLLNGRFTRHHHMNQNVTDMISSFGYPVQNMTVQTKDGYLLDLIRIPGSVEYKSQFEQMQHQQHKVDVNTDKPVVVLMHGLLSSAEDFVIGGPSEGLAFYLADQGYDVFLANARGNMYARKHTTLNPEKDAAFWRFCWSDIGKIDLPAIIDEVLRVTEQQKVYYIGHMQGTTAFYVMATELPEYNDKIEKMVSLGPIAYVGQATNKMLRTIADNQQSKSWEMKNLGVNEFHPSNDFMSTAGQQECMSQHADERVCQNAYFLMNGYESKNYNMTTIKSYVQRLPAGASTRQVMHYAQLVKSGRFEKLSTEQQPHPEEYDVSKISAPVAMLYAPNDKISTEQDVKYLINKLPHVVEDIKINQINNNMDLLYCNNVRSVVYKTVLDILKGR